MDFSVPRRWGSTGAVHPSCVLLIVLLPIFVSGQDLPLYTWGSVDPTTPAGGKFADLWAGELHYCALQSSQASLCWGNNTYNQVSPTPTLAPSANYFTSFGLGATHSCGVLDNGTVLCWGDDSYGQATPPAGLRFQLVVSGQFYSCGLLTNGSVTCWGESIPTPPAGDPKFTALALTVDQVCGLLVNGSALCWGSPTAAPAGLTFQQVCAANGFACGVLTNGSAVCWGQIDQQQVPPADHLFTSISCGWYHACGLSLNNTIRCWFWTNATQQYVSGPNSNPQLVFARVVTSSFQTAGLVGTPSPSPSASPSRYPSPSSTPPRLSSNATNAMPRLYFNVTQPKIDIQPAGGTNKVGVAIGRVAEVEANGTELLSAVICPGGWSEVWNDSYVEAYGAAQSFVFMADLAFGPNSTSSCTGGLGASDRPRIELQFFTFAKNSNISLDIGNSTGSLGNLLSYTISPSFAKFTLRLFHWPWLDNVTDDHRLEVGLDFSPAVASFVRQPASGALTTFELRGQETGADGREYSTQVRLLQAVSLDNVLVLANDSSGRAPVEFALDVARSQLVLSFARFNTSLDYDPDVGVLLGKDSGGGSDSNLAVIVGTAVAVPVAIALVLVVIGVGVVVLKWRNNRLRAGRVSINIDHSDLLKPDTEL